MVIRKMPPSLPSPASAYMTASPSRLALRPVTTCAGEGPGVDGLKPGRRRENPDPGPLRQAEGHAAVQEQNPAGLGGLTGILESNRAERKDIDPAPVDQVEDCPSFSGPQYGPIEDREGFLPHGEPAFARVDGELGEPEPSCRSQRRHRAPDDKAGL